jgi:uncharacterized protein with PIN domain
MAEEVAKETEEQRDARLREIARKAREIFGSSPAERRCPQCAKKMIVEYAAPINEMEFGGWVQSCWGCGYESRF